ncbi:hypothetical protein ABW21_db0208898 [Orbilia brochopaga]|nr:hypothetical protein ABW21_db0208898 [Drechslerella brochopaga]
MAASAAAVEASAIATLDYSHAPPPFNQEILDMIELAEAPGPPIPETYSNAPLCDLFRCAPLDHGWQYKGFGLEVSADGRGTSVEWKVEHKVEQTDVFVKMFLAAGGLQKAKVAFGTHLTGYSAPISLLFQAPANPDDIRGQFNLESTSRDPGSHVTLLWVYGNVFVHIRYRPSGHGPPRDMGDHIRGLANQLHEFISSGATPDPEKVIAPRIRSFDVGGREPVHVVVDGIFFVRISLEDMAYTMVQGIFWVRLDVLLTCHEYLKIDRIY